MYIILSLAFTTLTLLTLSCRKWSDIELVLLESSDHGSQLETSSGQVFFRLDKLYLKVL